MNIELPHVPFNAPELGPEELANLCQCLERGHISGDGPFTDKCHAVLKSVYGFQTLLVHSCTAALDAAAILANLGPGDEVIMPSFTFVSTANSVVLRGAVPVFVDIRADTLNIDETKIEAAITERTRAIVPVHYAGVSAAMDAIMDIAKRHGLTVIEDAAQGYGATYKGTPLGAIGDIGCISFHETKNVVSGEGGALIVKDPNVARRAMYVREKGTNRTEFLRREVTKYEWIDIGSSLLPSDLLAAVLLAQLKRADVITARRVAIGQRYAAGLENALTRTGFRFASIPTDVTPNGHIFYMLAPTPEAQQQLLGALRAEGVPASSHYVPLHSAPAGRRYGRTHGDLAMTDTAASTIVRLPCHSRLSDDQVDYTIERVLYHAR